MTRLLVALLVIAGCDGPKCREGTVFVDVTLDATSAEGELLDFVVAAFDGSGTPQSGRLQHPRGQKSGTVELTFTSTGYPAGLYASVGIVARRADETLIGRGATLVTLAPGCTHTFVMVDGVAPEPADLAQPVDLGPDLETPHWTQRPIPNVTEDLRGVIYTSRFLAVGSAGRIVSSSDGVQWTLVPTTITADLRSVAFGGGIYVTVGTNGFIASSPDGTTWTPRTQAAAQLNVVRYVGSTFLAAGNTGLLLTSSDGALWTPQVSNTSDSLYGLILGSDIVAVGTSGAVTVSSNQGLTWTKRSVSGSFDLYTGAWAGLASGQIYVAAGLSANELSSSDSVSWTSSLVGAGGLNVNGMIWDQSRFLAVGTPGAILTSPDGINWTAETTPTPSALYDLASSGTRYVVVGEAGTVLTKP